MRMGQPGVWALGHSFQVCHERLVACCLCLILFLGVWESLRNAHEGRKTKQKTSILHDSRSLRDAGERAL